MYRYVKRFIDLVLSLLVLTILSPLLVPVMILLKFTAEGYVFYFQERIGYKNSRFMIWKFATMLKASPGLGTGSITVKNDFRVTPVGKYLRKGKINELPQFFNVLIGDMSLVGPRPQMEVDFLKFPEYIQQSVYNLKPGITGIGSIVFRDEEKIITHAGGDPHQFYKEHIAPYKGELELWYQKNISFKTDILILFLTVWVVLFPGDRIIYSIFPGLPRRPESLKV